MQKANQDQLLQSINVNLVAIRTIEVTYFSNFFSSFGTLAALLIGLVIQNLSQIPGYGNACSIYWVYLYCVCTAIAFVFSMYLLVCSVFISVYGQGLALRGPPGSMVKAIEGMIKHQHEIVFVFVLTIFSLTLSIIGLYWIMNEYLDALMMTVITFPGIFYWYRNQIRIYNRFKWKKASVLGWNIDEDDDDFDLIAPNPEDRRKHAPANSSSNNVAEAGPRPSLGTMFANFFAVGRESAAADLNTVKTNEPQSAPTESTVAKESTAPAKDTEYAGYISLQVAIGRFYIRSPWTRVYMIVKGSRAYCYKSKAVADYRREDTIKRPIELDGYKLEFSIDEPPFKLLLLPATAAKEGKNPLELRCDTQAEAAAWIGELNRAINAAK